MQVAKSIYWPRFYKVSVIKKLKLKTVIIVIFNLIFKSPRLIQRNGIEINDWEEVRHRHIDHFKIL